ncbi:uncharacterized protein PHACADRAFT_251281 [Phanerochaete carnosa HHB-10118-sp]|uniref:Uncharacterized protein n=1 Tax=Phanerochaete carnosa (strain HHB-10118-sp) TaxID=650164 RepID=K5V4N2_PHACS|nr:uncharacterized protein PHACADRAFT_251281 [Phanerochaete carnosa HHB-10118-sp]EKM57586.1 hypothetical protein PHACADRAFT_251281 [Phanerochaete carnosa HHB-10118-sp]
MALLVLNIAQMLTYNSSTNVSPVSAFITILPLILINRFMINLRTVDSEVTVPGYSVRITDRQQGQSTLHFRKSTNRLGNIGETLQDGWSDEFWVEENGSAELGGARHRETSAEV